VKGEQFGLLMHIATGSGFVVRADEKRIMHLTNVKRLERFFAVTGPDKL